MSDLPEKAGFGARWAAAKQGYDWSAADAAALTSWEQPAFDEGELLRLASGANGEHFVLSFLTSEYLSLGRLWIQSATAVGIKRFAIGAGDAITVDEMRRLGVPCLEMRLPERLLGQLSEHHNPGGFHGKALALIYLRTRIAKSLIDEGIDVLCCDIDAIIRRNPLEYLRDCGDIAFQRVMYFPKPIVTSWGFAACAGFVAYRASTAVSELLTRVCALQQSVSSDQLALNWALFQGEPLWNGDIRCERDIADARAAFIADAQRTIWGRVPSSGLTLCALPATTFWRHSSIPFDLDMAWLTHPNSPKSLDEKLNVLRGVLGPAEMGRLQSLDPRRV